MAKRKHDEIAGADAKPELDETAHDEVKTVEKKVKREKGERVNATVFVQSLPYETTSTDLTTHFSFIGPVKNGFVVVDRASGESKGVGYVTFAEKEDADRAVAEMNNGSFGASTRKIRVTLADIKPTRKERGAASAAAEEGDIPALPGQLSNSIASSSRTKAIQPRAQKASGDPNAIRTLVLSGIPADVDKGTLWKRVRKVDGIEGGAQTGLTYPASTGTEGRAGGFNQALGNVAHILFETHQKAIDGIAKLHAHTYKGVLLSCVLKKRMDTVQLTQGDSGESSTGYKANRAGRLIIRNLPWNATSESLRALFLPFGPILSIDVPTTISKLPVKDPKNPPKPRARGFAFVWFLSRNDAEKAREGMNDKEIGDRKIAVDWAVSKDKYEEGKKDEDGEIKVEGQVKEEGKADEDEDSSGDDEDSSDGEDDDDAGKAVDDDAMDVDEEEKPVKPSLPAVEEGSTLFVRNLPFEVTEGELRDLFRAFGPLRYAKITMDKETGRSRGTGFACFWKTEDADKVLVEASRVNEITGANMIDLAPKNPFAMPSVLSIDPSASVAGKLVLHGRTLDVVRALRREDALTRKEDGERSRQKADKRNTYLMREGVIFPNTPAAATLPDIEVEKRNASFITRRKMLESNPSLYISKTRLSIRQIPIYATERTLKRLGIHAVREFDKEVEAGDREGLSREEQQDDAGAAALTAGKKKKQGERTTVVIQSKILRQNDRTDPLTGLGKSKGYGFLEMRTHQDSLKALRWANNNPDVGALMKEWVSVELTELEERMKEKLMEAREEKDKDLEELELKYKKLQAKVKDGVHGLKDEMKSGKTLLIEYSVENVQVIKRRGGKVSQNRAEGSSGRRQRPSKTRQQVAEDSDDDAPPAASSKKSGSKPKPSGSEKRRAEKEKAKDGGEDASGPPKKKRKTESAGDAANGDASATEKKAGKSIGGLIGKKRKERKGKAGK